jgi:hypothetical protein
MYVLIAPYLCCLLHPTSFTLFTRLTTPAGMSINPALGTYAAARWYPPGLIKRSETCSPESTEECTGFVTPDTIVTNDGRSFNLEGVDDATKTEFYELAASGKEVPKKFASLEQDVEGIAERVKKMTV